MNKTNERKRDISIVGIAMILVVCILETVLWAIGATTERVAAAARTEWSYIKFLFAPWPAYTPLVNGPKLPPRTKQPHILWLHGKILLRTGVDLAREIGFRLRHPSIFLHDLQMVIWATFDDDI